MKSKNITVYILALLFVLSLLEIYFIINLKIELEDMIYLEKEKENAKLCKLTCDLTDHEGSLYSNGNCYCLKYGVWLKYW
jgi:hypothetical protein